MQADAVIGPMTENDTRSTVGAESTPYRVGPARARVSGQRTAAQRPCESKVQILHIPVRGVRGDRRGQRFSRGKDSKTLVLAAFFGHFLPLLAESTPTEAMRIQAGV